jgi:cytidine deaminase
MDSTDLISAARELAIARYVEGRHHVFSAVRTKSGRVFTGVHVEAGVGRVAVCAEAIAIGAAATAGDTDIDAIVAVTESGQIVPPCGMCRELIGDYAPDAKVILQFAGNIESRSIHELLLWKYRSADYPNTRIPNKPNKAPEPTPTAVTPRAIE